ncbi:MAG: KpsF/GutQ family sugar-phosphate isomerase, partial [Phycisphaerales bacterium]
DAGGNVLVSGLGKSGLIGQKISATLASLAIPSHFVHPAEAAHGDLGRFRPADICILLSYSGQTAEVINLAALLRQDEIGIIGICRGTPDGSSPLERLSDVVLTIGDCDDPEFTPAPTCSTAATLALGDALALCAARRRNFTEDDFAKRHPGGTLGEVLRPVTEILRFVVGRNIVPVREDLSVRDALATADNSGVRRPGALLLTDAASGRLTGIFTDADLRRLIERNVGDLNRPIRELMTRSPQVLPDTALVRDAVQLVRESRRDEIPVVDASGSPVGILDVQDLVALRLVQGD